MDEYVKQFLRKFARLFWIVILLAALGAASGWYLGKPGSAVYTASATLVGFNRDKTVIEGSAATMDDLNFAQRVVERLQPVFLSNKVAVGAARKLMESGGPVLDAAMIRSMVSVSAQTNSIVMTLNATNPDAGLAIDVCNAVSEAFVEEVNLLMASNYISVLDSAQSARQSTVSDQKEIMVIGAFAGLILGVVLIYLFAVLDSRIFSLDDIPAELRNQVTIIPEHGIH